MCPSVSPVRVMGFRKLYTCTGRLKLITRALCVVSASPCPCTHTYASPKHNTPHSIYITMYRLQRARPHLETPVPREIRKSSRRIQASGHDITFARNSLAPVDREVFYEARKCIKHRVPFEIMLLLRPRQPKSAANRETSGRTRRSTPHWSDKEIPSTVTQRHVAGALWNITPLYISSTP